MAILIVRLIPTGEDTFRNSARLRPQTWNYAGSFGKNCPILTLCCSTFYLHQPQNSTCGRVFRNLFNSHLAVNGARLLPRLSHGYLASFRAHRLSFNDRALQIKRLFSNYMAHYILADDPIRQRVGVTIHLCKSESVSPPMRQDIFNQMHCDAPIS